MTERFSFSYRLIESAHLPRVENDIPLPFRPRPFEAMPMDIAPPSFGIELEFFLLDQDGYPVLGATQRVINRLP